MKHFKEFIKGEDGAETLEVALILVITVGLIAILGVIIAVVKNKMYDSAEAIDTMDGSSQSADWDDQKEDVSSALEALNGN